MGDRFGDKAAGQPEPGATTVSGLGPNFPHERVLKLWNARIKYSERQGKDNRDDHAQAVAFYRGGEGEWEGVSNKDWSGPKVSANIWARDVTLLTCYMLGSDPRILARSHKGDDLQPTAEAVAALGNYSYKELKYRVEIGSAMIEALLRNKSYVFQGWNSRMWLPTWRWCDGEVFLDPDANGDMKRARWVAEEYTANLEDLLEDEDIADDVKQELRARKNIQRPTVDRSAREKEDSSDANHDSPWDGQPGFTKLICYRVFSRSGVMPRQMADDNTVPDATPIFNDAASRSPHEALGNGAVSELTPPHPTPAFDAPPRARDFDAIDVDRNIAMLLVKGYDKVVKLGSWHMDHFGDTDWPYVRLQFNKLPRDEDGVPMFKLLKPLFVYINMILSIGLTDARDSSRRIFGIDTQKVKSAEDIETIVNGPHLAFFKSDGQGAVEQVEFSARNEKYMELLPRLKEMHDEASGVTDTMRGQSNVEKTAAEAQILDAKSEAALASIDEALETFQNDISRLSLMAIQRYVRATSRYEPCSTCAQVCETCGGDGGDPEGDEAACPDCLGRGIGRGAGTMPDPYMENGTPGQMGLMPCPTCSDPNAPPVQDQETGEELGDAPGNGWDQVAFQSRKPMQRGADFYLADHYVEAWRDDVGIEQIRAEILIYIKKGSSRRDYQERRVAVLTRTLQTLGPIYEKYGIFTRFFKLVQELAIATDPDDEELAPSDEEVDAAIAFAKKLLGLQMQQLAGPPPGPPPPPPPDPIAMAKAQSDAQAKQQANALAAQKMQGDHALKGQELQANATDASAKIQIELKKLALEEQRLALEAAQMQQTLADLQAELGETQKKHGALEAERQKAFAAVPPKGAGAHTAGAPSGVVPPGNAWPVQEEEVTPEEVRAIIREEMSRGQATTPAPAQAPAAQATPMFQSLHLHGNIEGGINMPEGSKVEITGQTTIEATSPAPTVNVHVPQGPAPSVNVHVPPATPAEVHVHPPAQEAPVIHVHPTPATPAPSSGSKKVTIHDATTGTDHEITVEG